MGWDVRHGPATLGFELGRPASARDARLPDGTRAPLVRASIENMFGGEAWRMPRPDGVGVVLGRLVVTDDDLAFVPDDEQPIARRSWSGDGGAGAPDLRDDLAGDPAVAARLGDRDFAVALYQAFENERYRKDDTEAHFALTFRSAGGFVAEARGIGEDYLDFYCERLPQTLGARADALRAEVLAAIERLGWHRLDDAAIAADRDRALALLDDAATRPGGEAPDWTRGFPPDAGGPLGRAWTLAIEGRLTADEFTLVTSIV